jgi:DNA-directed RNA polymerase specialized sigma24 family protein
MFSMMGGMIAHTKLFALSNATFDKLRKQKYWRYILPSDEWDDIRSKAAIRVFAKRGLYSKRKGALEPWVYRVVDNAIKNGVRDYLGAPTSQRIGQRRAMLPINLAPITAAAHVMDECESKHPAFYIDDYVGECMSGLSDGKRDVFSAILNGEEPKSRSRLVRGQRYNTFCAYKHYIKQRFKSSLYATDS